MDKNFIKKLETLYKNKQFDNIKFEIAALKDKEKENSFILNLLGIIETSEKKIDKARNYFELALKKDPEYLHSLLNLSRISLIDNNYQNTILLLKKYDEKHPGNTSIILNLSNLTFGAGFVEDSIYYHEKLIESGNFNLKDLTALIFLQNYSSKYSNEKYKKYCDLYNKIISKGLSSIKININERDQKKIGFLSNDLRDHPVGYFIIDFINELKNRNFIPVAFNLFSDEINQSNFTKDLKKSFSEWNNVKNLSNFELCKMINEKKIYYLFDLGGYNAGNRLEIFKNKPAPVQISWLGYCNSTQIEEIDYIISDPYTTTIKEENFYKEKILKMPHIWNTHSKLSEEKINQLPVVSNEFFTFGSFNNYLKISDEVIETWNKILVNIHNSKLVLKSRHSVDKNFKSYIIKKFDNSINSERLIFLNTVKDKKKHLNDYNKIDISLDTFPYNGVTTSFESIWMGVPVLVLKGNRFVSRCGYSINKNLGLEDFIAENKEDYISKACKLASKDNIDKLKELRQSLRKNSLSSPLFNIKLFTDSFVKLLNEV